ncbi:hypothetical protein [Streptomyces sp. YGL11-2]|uniref:hypothetical protein n=1 Tax=Streptomyces sp. YGL11-2 TaxID=3414028 RepID=UPI003CE8E28E
MSARTALAALREHLVRLDEPDPVRQLVGFVGDPAPRPPRVLAALEPRALELARAGQTARSPTSSRRSTRPEPARRSGATGS